MLARDLAVFESESEGEDAEAENDGVWVAELVGAGDMARSDDVGVGLFVWGG